MRGIDIVEEVGPPDRKSKKRPVSDEDAMDGGADDAEEGDSEDAKVSAAGEFQDAVKNGTPEEVAKAFDQLCSLYM